MDKNCRENKLKHKDKRLEKKGPRIGSETMSGETYKEQ